jgi:hypothetical protein
MVVYIVTCEKPFNLLFLSLVLTKLTQSSVIANWIGAKIFTVGLHQY